MIGKKIIVGKIMIAKLSTTFTTERRVYMFSNLHVHTSYSVLDGACKIEELILRAKELGQQAIAITDHGSTSGLYEAQKIGEKHGIKVIQGTEFYCEREDGESRLSHLIVLAKNNTGLRNIFKLQEYAFIENFYRKPRINLDKLFEFREGLVVTSACLANQLSQYILKGEDIKALEWARKMKAVFGEDFYLEIQPNEIPEQLITNQTIARIAYQLGIKLIATNDVHYVYEEDAFAHEVLLALQTNKKMSDEKRFRFSTNDFFLKSEDEMRNTFKELSAELVQQALDNTQEIVDKCTSRIEKGHYLPDFYDVPPWTNQREMLVEKTKQGIVKRGMQNDKPFIAEVQNEIDVIDRNGYSGYFLIVQDYVTSAKAMGNIVGDGRGSGAGSKVAWLTGITEIPPHHYDLLFERFMADGREPDSIESSNMETYCVNFGEPRLQVGVHHLMC